MISNALSPKLDLFLRPMTLASIRQVDLTWLEDSFIVEFILYCFGDKSENVYAKLQRIVDVKIESYDIFAISQR